ncbi:transcriptional regulator [Paenibacillus sp. 598K]|uniref:Crp/Fnr family transcriptional regulator n=1 Tax=Paenibacillus sp. 598K TaxID=1117987 RepID=UPI000FF90C0A|nr:Crp/Fnr family transcriptional regulator [Paenibacillus sp. 598K]GBF73437.1 transcriptional regulator [Paenibacillus sp. 598K]
MKIIDRSNDIQQELITYSLSFLSAHTTQPEHIHLREYNPGENIMQEGDELDGLYLQVQGASRVSSSIATGKSLLLRFGRPLSIFGDIELIRNVPVQSRVDAATSSRFIFLNKTFVHRKIMQETVFQNLLLEHLAYKLQTCTTASRINLLATVEERLASYLLTTRGNDPFGQEIYSPHIADIASVIGTTPRHLNRVLQRLHIAGIIHKSRQSLVIEDWNQIENIANGLRYE